MKTESPSNIAQAKHTAGPLRKFAECVAENARHFADDYTEIDSLRLELRSFADDAERALADDTSPDLLTALEEVAAFRVECDCTVEERFSGHRVECHAPSFQEIQATARAAIARATGAQP